MTLLAIILTIFIQHYLGWGENFSRQAWIKDYLLRMQSLLQRTPAWNSVVGIVLMMLPLLAVVGFCQWFLSGWFFSVLKFILDLTILWFCLDSYHLKNELHNYFSHMLKDDNAQAQQEAKKFVRADKSMQFAGENLTALARAVSCEIFIRAEEKLFGVLFWFIILGSVGAVAYYLAVTIRDLASRSNSPFVELLLPAIKIFGILDWIPVRLLAMSYALVGHFVAGVAYCRKNFFASIEQTTEFAINAGFAALNMEHVDVIHADIEENQNALALMERALFLWIVTVAIFTLGGWL